MRNKVLKIICSFLIIFFIGAYKANAASATISVSSSASKIIVGNTITVTVRISSTSPLGSWNFDVVPSSNLKLTYSSFGGLYIADFVSSSSQKSATYTFKFQAIKSGTATVSIKNSLVYGYDEVAMSKVNGSTSISVITQAQLEASYSKNNNLSSLSIDGVALSPTFNKDTLEYTTELLPETTKINVTASKEDNKASIIGTGEIAVVDGNNRIEIKVTAENGGVKTYVINALVKEYNPIEVKIGDKTYTVVRKKSLLTSPNNYTETAVTINDEEVPAFTSEITGYTLVGLKDSDGKIGYYIYDGKDYTLYQELAFNRVLFYPMEADEKNIPKNYNKVTITYNDSKVPAYKIDSSSKFALLYGMDVESGEKGYYLFDSVDDTLQRYNTEEIDILNQSINIYLIIMIVTSSTTLIFLSLSIILLMKILKKGKNSRKTVKSPMDEYMEKTANIEEELKKGKKKK
jgi:hypothetical protein